MVRLIAGFALAVLIAAAFIVWQWRHKYQPTANFEIREVRCTEDTTDSSWQYTCQGTLLTREDAYQNAELVVWFEDVTKHVGDKDLGSKFLQNVRMSKGVATLTAGAYYSRKRLIGSIPIGDFEIDPGPPQPSWKILGFSRLESVNVSVQK